MTNHEANVEEGQIIESQPSALQPQAVMLTPKTLKKQMERDQEMRAIVNDYIKNNMVEGKDFGTITIKGKESKPSLFKPGGEKFCSLFKIRPTFRKDNETVEMLGNTPGIIAYICDLVDTRGRVVGEGRGVAKADLSADFDINKQVKIAQKRAQIDAVLRTGGLSDFFTQDVEDMPRDNQTAPENVPHASQKQIDLIVSLLTKKKIPSNRWPEIASINGFPKSNEMNLKQASAFINLLMNNQQKMPDDIVDDIDNSLDDTPYADEQDYETKNGD